MDAEGGGAEHESSARGSRSQDHDGGQSTTSPVLASPSRVDEDASTSAATFEYYSVSPHHRLNVEHREDIVLDDSGGDRRRGSNFSALFSVEHSTSLPPPPPPASGVESSTAAHDDSDECLSGDVGPATPFAGSPSPLLLPPRQNTADDAAAAAAIAAWDRQRPQQQQHASFSPTADLGTPTSLALSSHGTAPASATSMLVSQHPFHETAAAHYSSAASESPNIFSMSSRTLNPVTPVLESTCLACGEISDRSAGQMVSCATPVCRRAFCTRCITNANTKGVLLVNFETRLCAICQYQSEKRPTLPPHEWHWTFNDHKDLDFTRALRDSLPPVQGLFLEIHAVRQACWRRRINNVRKHYSFKQHGGFFEGRLQAIQVTAIRSTRFMLPVGHHPSLQLLGPSTKVGNGNQLSGLRPSVSFSPTGLSTYVTEAASSSSSSPSSYSRMSSLYSRAPSSYLFTSHAVSRMAAGAGGGPGSGPSRSPSTPTTAVSADLSEAVPLAAMQASSSSADSGYKGTDIGASAAAAAAQAASVSPSYALSTTEDMRKRHPPAELTSHMLSQTPSTKKRVGVTDDITAATTELTSLLGLHDTTSVASWYHHMECNGDRPDTPDGTPTSSPSAAASRTCGIAESQLQEQQPHHGHRRRHHEQDEKAQHHQQVQDQRQLAGGMANLGTCCGLHNTSPSSSVVGAAALKDVNGRPSSSDETPSQTPVSSTSSFMPVTPPTYSSLPNESAGGPICSSPTVEFSIATVAAQLLASLHSSAPETQQTRSTAECTAEALYTSASQPTVKTGDDTAAASRPQLPPPRPPASFFTTDYTTWTTAASVALRAAKVVVTASAQTSSVSGGCHLATVVPPTVEMGVEPRCAICCELVSRRDNKTSTCVIDCCNRVFCSYCISEGALMGVLHFITSVNRCAICNYQQCKAQSRAHNAVAPEAWHFQFNPSKFWGGHLQQQMAVIHHLPRCATARYVVECFVVDGRGCVYIPINVLRFCALGDDEEFLIDYACRLPYIPGVKFDVRAVEWYLLDVVPTSPAHLPHDPSNNNESNSSGNASHQDNHDSSAQVRRFSPAHFGGILEARWEAIQHVVRLRLMVSTTAPSPLGLPSSSSSPSSQGSFEGAQQPT